MTAYTETQMHQDHLRWTNDRGMWRDDLRVWQEETARALAELKQLQVALEALEVHGGAIRSYEQSTAAREHALVQEKRKCNDEAKMSLAMTHGRDVLEHDRLLVKHEEIKHHHREAMAHMQASLKAACNQLPQL
jgi:hypothetical protein